MIGTHRKAMKWRGKKKNELATQKWKKKKQQQINEKEYKKERKQERNESMRNEEKKTNEMKNENKTKVSVFHLIIWLYAE